nr:ATP-binding protein [Nakamurella flavida]
MAVAAFGYGQRLLTQAHDSSQEERRRISRQLHDVAAPTVAVALQSLELHGIYAQDDPERAGGKLDAARAAMETVGTLVRELSAELRHHVDDGGLVAAVQAALDAVPSAVRTSLQTAGPVDALPAAFAEETFLVVREAVRNAVTHAAPTAVTVELTAADGLLTVTVTDDGAGFDVEAVRAGERHVGMDSMGERAQLLSATLDVHSEPGIGTRVVLRVPSGAQGR